MKVLDFGVAKMTDPAERHRSETVTAGFTREGVIVGTPAYMSPEQSRGQVVDKRTDLWAFGCVLYEMLTGQRPFEGETSSQTMAAVQTDGPRLGPAPAAGASRRHCAVEAMPRTRAGEASRRRRRNPVRAGGPALHRARARPQRERQGIA